jgi:hypothetical protein
MMVMVMVMVTVMMVMMMVDLTCMFTDVRLGL